MSKETTLLLTPASWPPRSGRCCRETREGWRQKWGTRTSAPATPAPDRSKPLSSRRPPQWPALESARVWDRLPRPERPMSHVAGDARGAAMGKRRRTLGGRRSSAMRSGCKAMGPGHPTYDALGPAGAWRGSATPIALHSRCTPLARHAANRGLKHRASKHQLRPNAMPPTMGDAQLAFTVA